MNTKKILSFYLLYLFKMYVKFTSFWETIHFWSRWQSRKMLYLPVGGGAGFSAFGARAEGAAVSQKEELEEAIVSFLSLPIPHSLHNQVGTISKSPTTWLTLFVPPWRFHETPPHSNCWPTQTSFRVFFIQMACLSANFTKTS